MTNKEILVDAKLDCWTAGFSDDFSAQKRDDETYAKLIAGQTEFTDEQISDFAGKLFNGIVTRQEMFG